MIERTQIHIPDQIPGYVLVRISPSIFSYQVEGVSNPGSHGYFDTTTGKVTVTVKGSKLDLIVAAPAFSIESTVGDYMVLVAGGSKYAYLTGKKFYIHNSHSHWVTDFLDAPGVMAHQLMAMSDFVVDDDKKTLVKSRMDFKVSELLNTML